MGPLFLVFGAHPAKERAALDLQMVTAHMAVALVFPRLLVFLSFCLSSPGRAGRCGRVMCLNPSGCWPGLGPLLTHFSSPQAPGLPSILSGCHRCSLFASSQ